MLGTVTYANIAINLLINKKLGLPPLMNAEIVTISI